MRSLGKHAIVVGAGMAGLTAAKALSRHFERITVLERDALPREPEARTGTPQSRHVHALLKGGVDALEVLFPGFEAELEAAGAIRTRLGSEVRLEMQGFDPFPKRDLGLDLFFMTRPLVEFVTRRFVERQDSISIQSRSRAIELLMSTEKGRVTGVRCQRANGETVDLTADLVVDSSSRGALTTELLERISNISLGVTEIGVDISYATAIFERPPAAPSEWRAIMHRPDAEIGRGGFLFPIENNRWHVNLNGVHGDQPPGDREGFMAFAKTLRKQTIHDAIRGATFVGPIYRYNFPCSYRRRFEALTSFPTRLIPIGDVICRFNPAFGQGMSVAAQEAGILDRLCQERRGQAEPLDRLAEDFFAAIQETLLAPWSIAEGDFMFERTRGERPPDLQRRQEFSRALFRLAAEDASVHRLMVEVNNLSKPTSALRSPDIVSRVTALMASDS